MSEEQTGQIERLQAELAEVRGWQSKAVTDLLCLALRVKRLEDALKLVASDESGNCNCCGFGFGEHSTHCELAQALSDSDRTADEVISEFLGEQFTHVGYKHPNLNRAILISELENEQPDFVAQHWITGTKLYAPRGIPENYTLSGLKVKK